MELAVLAFVWLPLAIAAGFYATKLRRNGFAWSVAALVFSPLVAFVFLFVLGARPRLGRRADDRVLCPMCAEDIKPAAIRCPHCRVDLDTLDQWPALGARRREP
jgi:hypothetical protein